MYVSAYWPFSSKYKLQDVLCVDYMYLKKANRSKPCTPCMPLSYDKINNNKYNTVNITRVHKQSSHSCGSTVITITLLMAVISL